MRLPRRAFLKAFGTAVVGTAAVSGTASASEWRYELVGEALEPGVKECVIQDHWAYTAMGDASLTTVDLSDPEFPVVSGTALGEGTDNFDAKVDADVAGLANDGAGPDDSDRDLNPGGVTFFDVSDPADPKRVSFYPADSGIHNHFIEGGYAYLCVNESDEAIFDASRVEILDVTDPSDPALVGSWGLRDRHPEMATAFPHPLHDIYVQDDVAYLAYWDAGCIILDVSDKGAPQPVAHFGATDDADEPWDDTVELYQRYLGNPGNAHYVQPTPDGSYTLVGDETFPGPFEDTVIPGDHGGIRIFDTSDVSRDSSPGDPTEEHVAFIPSPDKPESAVRTAHNFDVTDDKLFGSWYQGGLRAYDLEDPTDPRELAAFAPPQGYHWTNVELPTSGHRTYTVGSNRSEGLTVLELVHETHGEQDWDTDEDLDPTDVLEPTMQEPL